MMCMTVLPGGVCHRTSTPHKSGNKMKEKKKVVFTYNSNTFKKYFQEFSNFWESTG